MSFTTLSNRIFTESILDYHKEDHVDTPIQNPYELRSIEYYLYLKNWIDTVQWHLEDIIRDPNIEPSEALKIKRQVQPRPHGSGGTDRQLFSGQIQEYPSKTGRYHQYRKPGMGHRPTFHPGIENTSHAPGSGAYGDYRRTSCAVRSQTEHSAGATA